MYDNEYINTKMYFDIGSNIGEFSQCDKIISIEASPITFKSLVDNCKNDNIILLMQFVITMEMI